jgi:two-component system chemotaxis response regulator CheY
MEYHVPRKFDYSHAVKGNTIDYTRHWRLFDLRFNDLASDINKDDLAMKIFRTFESLPGSFYYEGRDQMTVFCKIGEKVVIDDIAFKIKSLIKGDYMCRIGEQGFVGDSIVSIQFVISPTSSEQQKLSQEFVALERQKRNHDVIMVVEDDLFARNIAKSALQSKFKLVEVTDGGKAAAEYLSHSPDVVFLDIHLPNKKGPDILQEIMEVDPKAYVVMLSADAAQEKVMACVRNGAKGFIAKPFKGEKLYDYIRKCPTIRVYC